jgi:Domain of unknown function (DUF4465)
MPPCYLVEAVRSLEKFLDLASCSMRPCESVLLIYIFQKVDFIMRFIRSVFCCLTMVCCVTQWCSLVVVSRAAIVVDFESLPTDASGFYNGDTGVAGPQRNNYSIVGTRDNFGSQEFVQRWNVNGVQFENNYTPNFASWSGWSWSRVQNTTNPSFTNQYASFPGGGATSNAAVQPGGTYAIGFGTGSFFNIPTGFALQSVDLTNTTYAALVMRDGNAFSKKFGGNSGNEPDHFRVILNGFDQLGATGNVIGSRAVDLADYRFANNNLDFILSNWQRVDLTGLANARSLALSFESTDVGAFGINTPLYVALDNLTLTAVPEPVGVSLLAVGIAVATLGRRRGRLTASTSNQC